MGTLTELPGILYHLPPQGIEFGTGGTGAGRMS